jgi:hypothetical protein
MFDITTTRTEAAKLRPPAMLGALDFPLSTRSFPTRSRYQHVYKTLRTVKGFFRTRSTLITASQKPSKGAPAGLLQPADRH